MRPLDDPNATGTPTTISQRVAAALALRPLLLAEGKRRQAHGLTAPGRRKSRADGRRRHNTLAVLSAKVGMAGSTLLKAIEVVEAARREPERLGGVVRKMDETENVEAAYLSILHQHTVRTLSQPEIFTTTVIGGSSLGEFSARELRWLVVFFAELGACIGAAHDDVRAAKLLLAAQVRRAIARADRALNRGGSRNALSRKNVLASCRTKRFKKASRSASHVPDLIRSKRGRRRPSRTLHTTDDNKMQARDDRQ